MIAAAVKKDELLSIQSDLKCSHKTIALDKCISCLFISWVDQLTV